jgi:hypothetical protein
MSIWRKWVKGDSEALSGASGAYGAARGAEMSAMALGSEAFRTGFGSDLSMMGRRRSSSRLSSRRLTVD